MDAMLKEFRKQHECKYCVYFKKECSAKERCVFDYLPFDSVEEEVELFLIS